MTTPYSPIPCPPLQKFSLMITYPLLCFTYQIDKFETPPVTKNTSEILTFRNSLFRKGKWSLRLFYLRSRPYLTPKSVHWASKEHLYEESKKYIVLRSLFHLDLLLIPDRRIYSQCRCLPYNPRPLPTHYPTVPDPFRHTHRYTKNSKTILFLKWTFSRITGQRQTQYHNKCLSASKVREISLKGPLCFYKLKVLQVC